MRQFNLFVASGVVVKAPRDGKFSFQTHGTEVEGVLASSQARAATKRLAVNKRILVSGKLTAKEGCRPHVAIERLRLVVDEKL